MCVRGEGHETGEDRWTGSEWADGEGQESRAKQLSGRKVSTGVDNMAVGKDLDNIFRQQPDCGRLRRKWMVRT